MARVEASYVAECTRIFELERDLVELYRRIIAGLGPDGRVRIFAILQAEHATHAVDLCTALWRRRRPPRHPHDPSVAATDLPELLAAAQGLEVRLLDSYSRLAEHI